jgi:hypothetical protein
MQLCFKNNHSSLISVAVIWYDPNSCGGEGGNWSTEGWWDISPGNETHTSVWTGNRYFYFFAEAQDDTVWNGPFGPVDATPQAFRGCVDIGSTADSLSLGMRQVDAGWWFWSYITFTVTLN